MDIINISIVYNISESKDVTMSISLDFGRYNNYEISDSRICKMMGGDRKNATKMNLWEQFKDLFRADKKSDAYNELYNMLHDTERCDKLDTFNKLKKLAKPEHQVLFKKEIFRDNVKFSIGNECISTTSIQKLINVSEQTSLPAMSELEERLFLDMLDTLRAKESQLVSSRPSDIRNSTSYEHCYELLNLYRPQEEIDSIGTEWRMADSLTKSEEDLLRCLNAGSMTSFSQFYFMGYQKKASDVEFTMVHPLISFLQGTYTRDINDFFSFTEVNTSFLTVLIKGYEDYHNNKIKIDTLLKRIYEQHDETLNISHLGQNRNKLVTPFDIDSEYIMQDSNFSDEVNELLSAVWNKWTHSNVNFSEGARNVTHDADFQ